MAANFRDVMIALGLYPDDDAVMGVEASGIVVETDSDDGRFAVGDRVTGLFPEGTGTMATTDARLLMEIPTGWSYADAATAPVVFATAYYALTTLADVQAGPAGVGACRDRWGGDGGGAVGPAFGVGGVRHCQSW